MCSEEGFFRNPNDCVKFYRCVRNEGEDYFRVYDFACGPGTVFDPTISTCNHPNSAPPCDNQQLPPGNQAAYSAQPPQTQPTPALLQNQPQPPQHQPQPPQVQPAVYESYYNQNAPIPPLPSTHRSQYPPHDPYSFIPRPQVPNQYSPRVQPRPQDEWPTETYSQPSSGHPNYPDIRDYLPSSFSEAPSEVEHTTSKRSSKDDEQQLTNMDEDEIEPEDEDCNCKPVQKVFQCKKEGKFADKKSCQNFYRCTTDEEEGGFEADQFECDLGKAFDEASGKCVPEDESECKKKGLKW